MALVFRGWHVLLEQPIAIKILKDEYCGSPEAVARFLREARATARLQGRHVAHVFDIGKVEGRTPFMVTELLNGSDLGKLLTAGAFSPERAVATLVAVCDAVLEVHAAGIVHRDLKPDNLFLVPGNSGPYVKILDFGVAKPLKPGPGLTLPERGVGSPHYMSPEQIMTPLDVDFRSDVWSLGVVLFELLSLRMPFSGTTIPDLCAAIVRSDVSPLSRLRPGDDGGDDDDSIAMPAALERIICKCLEKDRAARFQSVAALREALLDVHRELTESARPKVGRTRATLLLASLVACVLTCALTFTAVVLLFDTSPEPAPLAHPDQPVGKQSGNGRKASLASPSAPASLVAAVLCDTGEFSRADGLASGANGCRTERPDTARVLQNAAPRSSTAEGTLDAQPTPSTRRQQAAHVPPGAELGRAVPEPLESWLWLERDVKKPELADDDVIDPYPDKRYTPR